MRSNQTQLRCRELPGAHVFNQTQIQYRDWVSLSACVQPGTAPVVWLSWFQHKCSTRSRFGIVSELVPTTVFNQAQLWHRDWVGRAHVFNQIQSWPDEVDSMACVQPDTTPAPWLSWFQHKCSTRHSFGTESGLVRAHGVQPDTAAVPCRAHVFVVITNRTINPSCNNTTGKLVSFLCSAKHWKLNIELCRISQVQNLRWDFVILGAANF